MRIAVLHHWFVTRGGGERVAECIASLFPGADLFTLMSARAAVPPSLQSRRIRTSFLQAFPGSTRMHRHLMPLYPLAARSIDLRGYDLVLSSDAGPVKGARVRRDAVHLCYCHSPMRYLYDGYEQYRRDMRPTVRRVFSTTAPYVRRTDRAAAQNVTGFLANSHYVAERIQRLYGRTSEVVYPPIDISRARRNTPGDHYLVAGRLVPYKRTEIMIEACERLGRNLRIAGTGSEEKRLRAIAGPYTTFLGELSDEALWDEYSRCRALLFAADEDFGMVPLEVQACGRPVLAFGFGGSLETVRGENPPVRYAPQTPEQIEESHAAPTGMYFTPQTAEALAMTMLRFEADQQRFEPSVAQAYAAGFDTPIFLNNLRNTVLRHMPSAAADMRSVESAMQTLTHP